MGYIRDVQTRLEPPLAPPEPPPATTPPRRRRRWPRWLALAGVLAVVVALIAGGTWVARYDPLTHGSIGYRPIGVKAQLVDVSYALTDPPQIFRVQAVTGMTFRYRFAIANAGPVAITIKDVGLPEERSGDVVNRRPVRVMTNAYAGPTGSPWIGFRPFTLAPGQEGGIEMQATLTGCLTNASTISWGEEEITFSVFGLTRHETFTPDIVMALVGSDASACHAP